MNTKQHESLSRTKQYLYSRLKGLADSGNYHLSDSITQQIQALSTYRYTAATRGDMRNFFALLKDTDVVDMEYSVNGCAIWLPHGVKYKNQFVSEMSKDLDDNGYEEYLFPSLVSVDDFSILCDEIYDFKDQALNVSAHSLNAVLKPTGESAIYPTLSRWLKDGKKLPIKMYQSGPYFRYKSSPNAYLTPIECSFMLESHGIFASKEDMNKEYERSLKICQRWIDMLCLDAFVVSRPIAFNKPVSTMTIGFDVLLPNGKTIQAAMSYLQSQIFSQPYGVRFTDRGVKRTAEQMTFGITERSIYTSLFAHVDGLGLRLASSVAPEQVSIICRDDTGLSLATAKKLKDDLRSYGIRTSTLTPETSDNPYELLTHKGTPLQIIIDDASLAKGVIELLDRRSLDISTLEITPNIPAAIRSILQKGDELLLREQSLIKGHAIHTLQSKIESHPQVVEESQKKCYTVVVHENDKCINDVQSLGLGEYIGTDQSGATLESPYCYSCGEECKTFGYLAKRL